MLDAKSKKQSIKTRREPRACNLCKADSLDLAIIKLTILQSSPTKWCASDMPVKIADLSFKLSRDFRTIEKSQGSQSQKCD